MRKSSALEPSMFLWIFYVAVVVEGLNETAKRIRVDNELYCRTCGYNLRGLSRPQCPECGTELTASTVESGRLLIPPRLRKAAMGIASLALAAALVTQIVVIVS